MGDAGSGTDRPSGQAWLAEPGRRGPESGGTVPPASSDPLVTTASQRLGGPLGQHADVVGRWWNPARTALLTATLCYLAGVIFRLPCRVADVDHFRWMCYSDIGILYRLRGLMQGNIPYLDAGAYPVLEYPVLTGWFLHLERLLATALGAPVGADLTGDELNRSVTTFVDVNVVVLGVLLLVTVWAQVRSVPHRPWDAMMVAASPCVAATALVNWDLLPVALTALGVMFWARKQPVAAGVLWGLGMAAKLYPLFLLGPLLLLCLRAGRMRELGRMLVAFAVAWLVVNLPALWLAPERWLSFWTFNSDRSGDLGSIWYVLSLAGYPVERLNGLALTVFGLLCAVIAALILLAPRRPRIGQVMFLVVVAFLLTNKVYSPQYVLWLLPFAVLARPVWRDWLVLTAGELAYFGAVWWHLGGLLAPGGEGPDRVYWLAVIVRMAAQVWIAVVVVRDLWRPEHDVVRHPPGVDRTFDDPTGGVLDGASDVGWLPLRRPVPVAAWPAALGSENPTTDGFSAAVRPDGSENPTTDGFPPPVRPDGPENPTTDGKSEPPPPPDRGPTS